MAANTSLSSMIRAVGSKRGFYTSILSSRAVRPAASFNLSTSTCRLFSAAAPTNFAASPRRSSIVSLSTVLIAAASLAAGAAAGFRFSPLELYTGRSAPLPAAGSPEEAAFIAAIEKELQSSRVVQKMRATEGYVERRMWADVPQKYLDSGFLSGSLRGPGKFAVPGIVFVNEEEKKVVSVIHCGRKVCGFPRIVHGGVIASLLDECLARAAILPLPAHTAVTANLTVNYRRPTQADQVISIETEVTENTDRKSLVSGVVKSAHGEKLAEATAVFVVPKHYKLQSLASM
ncbi:HotDog domain-containing protein [Myxozyma melibiosi]|uniref:HotDog domain-containing protein n=1 Tax=Myxozyma melibiosi TaxID=54550 RepID=A0ABR1EZS8_9ASCO